MYITMKDPWLIWYIVVDFRPTAKSTAAASAGTCLKFGHATNRGECGTPPSACADAPYRPCNSALPSLSSTSPTVASELYYIVICNPIAVGSKFQWRHPYIFISHDGMAGSQTSNIPKSGHIIFTVLRCVDCDWNFCIIIYEGHIYFY